MNTKVHEKRRHSFTPLFPLIFSITLLLFSCTRNMIKTEGDKSTGMDFKAVLQDMEKELSGRIKGDRPMRLAVLKFDSTKEEQQAGLNEFGEYLSESIISILDQNMKRFKLFERNRLDLLLQENSLNLTGLISADQAKKIGELAPVDSVLSGTYTKLENDIDINSRLIDVVTGEILLAYSARINLTDDLRSLFKEGRPEDTTEEEVCQKNEERITQLLNDLSTLEKVRNLVEEAKKIPFEGPCVKAHYTIMRHFERYNIDDKDYDDFLMKAIAGIQFPSQDYRTADAMNFIARKDRSETKWQLCLDTVKRSGMRSIEACLQPFVNYSYPPDELKEIEKRIDQYMSLVKKGEVGLPKPLTFDQGFLEMFNAADYTYATNNTVTLYCYTKYKESLTWDENIVKTINSYLTRIYVNEKDKVQKAKIMELICGFFNQRQADEQLADDMFQFSLGFTRTAEYLKKNPEEAAKVPAAHLKVLVEKCRAQFCKVLPLTKFSSAKEERVSFCLENGLECAGTIPSSEECAKQLSSKDWTERIEAIKLLSKMGARAKNAESAVIRSLERESIENSRESEEIHRYAALILGNLRTTDPKALELLITCLGSQEYDVPSIALDSLVAIGKPAVPFLIKGLENEQGSIQYKSAKALGLIGPAAGSARPALTKMLKSSNRDVAVMAREALEQIGE